MGWRCGGWGGGVEDGVEVWGVGVEVWGGGMEVWRMGRRCGGWGGGVEDGGGGVGGETKRIS